VYTQPGRRYKRQACGISFLLLVILYFSLSVSPVCAQDPPYLQEVLASALSQQLHQDPYWHILLHYQHGLSGIVSLIDDPAFFLAEDGKTNPKAELLATIRAFFNSGNDEENSSACRFVARYEWLKGKLNFDPARLGIQECRSFMDLLDKLAPKSVTLVFPMAHLNSPASMFGHTLLIIETADKSTLLAYSVSYSAVTQETMGPLFAVKSLFGLYPGYFAVLPYYTKLQQYSDVDHRDIWEYSLNLTDKEIRRMLLHIRELDSIASEYYFFSENCSYLLFFLLEAARPSLNLTDQFHAWMIPLDSIRMIEYQGLITGASHRPSRTTKIRHLASRTPEEGRTTAIAMARTDIPGDPFADKAFSETEKMKTCELAGEYLQYLYTKDKISEKTYQKRFLKILQQRSTLGRPQEETLYRISAPAQPIEGHGSNRFAIGAGFNRGEFFEEFRLRPAYHHLMDSDDGYVEGAQLIFCDIALRHYPRDNKLSLESLDLIDIFSLCPRDSFFHPISWKVKTGLTRRSKDDDHDRLVYQINPGGGMAFKNNIAGILYMMMETDLALSGALEGKYTAGIGGSAGIIKSPASFWKLHVSAKKMYYGFEEHFSTFEATMQQTIAIDSSQSISFDVSRHKTRDFNRTQVKILWNMFF